MRSFTKTVLACVLSSALTLAAAMAAGAGRRTLVPSDDSHAVLIAKAQSDLAMASAELNFWNDSEARYRAGVNELTRPDRTKDVPAFYLELNQQMLTRSTIASQDAALNLARVNARLAELHVPAKDTDSQAR